MLQAGLIGDPVAHSLSRLMHNAAFAALGIDADYALWETPLAQLNARVMMLRADNMLGANVTVPHKQAVIPFLTSLSITAQRAGAVNTIIPRNGDLEGDNTDAYGFARSLAEAIDPEAVHRAIIVGAGGASRAVLVALQDAGATEIVLVNRTQARAEELAADLSKQGRPAIRAESLDDLARIALDANVIVNATSLGWHGDELPFDARVLDGMAANGVMVDLTYRETAVLSEARRRGLMVLDGLPMLIHQGARAFELWTGQAAPVETMQLAVLDEQRRRAGAGS
jgi:shikimate dehydrogenase